MQAGAQAAVAVAALQPFVGAVAADRAGGDQPAHAQHPTNRPGTVSSTFAAHDRYNTQPVAGRCRANCRGAIRNQRRDTATPLARGQRWATWVASQPNIAVSVVG